MTGGDAGGPHREDPSESNKDDPAADTAAHRIASRPPGPNLERADATTEPVDASVDVDGLTPIAPTTDDRTPPSGTTAIDDLALLPPILQATTPPPKSHDPDAPEEPAFITPHPHRPTQPAGPDEWRLLRDRSAANQATATMTASRSAPAVPSGSVYRSTEERNRSVYRRANPWYRRLARGVIAASLITALSAGVYFGAREIQDYVDRDRLPAAGAEIPTIRETSFLVESTASGVVLDGTLSVDLRTGAFAFVGTPNGPNAADRLTSPDGRTVYAQAGGSRWTEQSESSSVVTSVRRAIDLLSDDYTSDAILTNRIRRGYVDLVRQIEEGTGSSARTRYDITLDLTSFAESFPLQWQSFQRDAVPGARESRRHPLSFWLDAEEVLVQVADEAAGWNWQRLTYSASAFEPFAPTSNQIEQVAEPATAGAIPCAVEELDLTYSTTLPTCEDANDVGRGLAVTAGLADGPGDPAAELAFVSVCRTIQGDTITTYDLDGYLELARLLDETGVCPGDVALLQPAG